MRVIHPAAGATGLVALLALSACTGAVASSGERVEGGTIIYAHQQEPFCVFGGWIEQAYLSYQVLDNLTSLDENHEVVPWLATEWSTSEDGLTWTFTLKEGVEFTDGSPLTAEVVAYNFDYWVSGGNSTALVWLQDYYSSAEAIDDLTVQINLSAPYPRLADNLTQGYFGIQSQVALETRTDEENCAAPIGSGAFIVDHWDRGEEIVLVRNDEYTSWPANAEHTGPAYVEEIVWRFVPDATTRVAALQSGEVDAIYDVPAVQWQTLDDAGYQLEKYVTPGRPQQLAFNTQIGPFTDVLVRQAFAYSLDRRAAVEAIGQGVIPYEGNGGVSQTTPGYSQAAADWYDYDPEKAAELLDEAGWTELDSEGFRTKDGERLTVVLPYGAGSIINADGAAILQGVKEQASQVGFDVELIPVPLSELFAGAYSTAEERDINVGYWTAVTAGILYINWRPSTEEAPNYSNGAFYNDEVLAQLIRDANSAADIDKQNALYIEAQDYIAERALSIGLYDRLSTLAVDTSLKGVWQEHAQGGPTFYDAYLTE
jgi:peptide/nickel transport system substrate-binding protein